MLQKLLPYIDVYGIEISLRENNSTRFHTIESGILSILSFIAIIVISVLFGNDIFVYKNAIVNVGDKFIAVNDTSRNLGDFPLIFLIWDDENYKYILNPSDYFKIEIMEFGTSPEGKYSQKKPVKKDWVKCDLKKWEKEYHDVVRNLALSDGFYCIDFEGINVKNDMDAIDSISQLIRIKNCNKKTDPICKQLNKLMIGMYSMHHVVNPDNYTHPLNYKLTNSIMNFDSKIGYNIKYELYHNQIETDKGKLLYEREETKYVTSKFFDRSINLKSEDDPLILAITSSSTVLSNKIIRRYKKIQDLLANIGGIVNAIFILGSLIMSNYNNFKFANFVRDELVLTNNKNFNLDKSNVNFKFEKFEKFQLSNLDKINFNDSKKIINESVSRFKYNNSALEKFDNKSNINISNLNNENIQNNMNEIKSIQDSKSLELNKDKNKVLENPNASNLNMNQNQDQDKVINKPKEFNLMDKSNIHDNYKFFFNNEDDI